MAEYIDRLVQERRNSIANALELRLSCSNPSILKHTTKLVIKADSICLVFDPQFQAIMTGMLAGQPII